MSIIGKTLGNFQCMSLLGRGGMGEVYQAKDQKLGRDVAIKVLPQEFAQDTDRVARFQREAKLLASLNHPNIAAIYGLEESDGTNFLVMELVEGDTLADQIKKDPIPVEEALKLALQTAEALEAAHEKGVIHRDLKPANIKVTPDGKVKVLDFGLAKAYAGEQSDINLSNSPTLSDAATQAGVILGTAAYMSPEQASGKAVDKRADTWAFGVVLFEMLTGQSLFTGENISQTLARVLERQPDFSTLPANLHPKIIEMLERCLEKDPKNRYSGISDARVDIQKVLADPGGVFAPPTTAVEPQNKLRTILPWIAAIIIIGVAVWILKPSPPPEPKRVVRFEHDLPDLPEDLSSTNIGQMIGRSALAVSPEGSHFVYGTHEGLFLRSVGELDARHIRGTDGNSTTPFLSPNGNWVGYVDTEENKLKKVNIHAGVPESICDVQGVGSANWNEDDTITYGAFGQGIMQVSANGGIPEILIEDAGLITAAPQVLPDGKFVLYPRWQNDGMMIVVHSLESGETEELFAGNAPRYLPTGHLVYVLNNNLLAVPFDPDTGEVTGDMVSIVDGVGSFFISDEGTLIYMSGISRPLGMTRRQSTLVWVDKDGKEEPLAAEPNYYSSLRISPDGTKVALTISHGLQETDISIWDINREILSPLTFFEGQDESPVWTLDGKRIIFSSAREGGGVYVKASNAIGEAEQIFSSPDRMIIPISLSSDEKTLLCEEVGSQTSATGRFEVNNDIVALSMEGESERRVLLDENYGEMTPMISPNGQYMAYESDKSGEWRVYVRPFPEVNEDEWPVSTRGGEFPGWSHDGRELYYLTRTDNATTVMAVTVETDPTFRLGNPETLFQGSFGRGGAWDVHPDGRFLIAKRLTPQADEFQAEELKQLIPRKINVVLNWFEVLKERVPSD